MYISYLKEQLDGDTQLPDVKKEKYYKEFFKNVAEGIQYYKTLPLCIGTGGLQFWGSLINAEAVLNELHERFLHEVQKKMECKEVMALVN